MSGWAGVCTLIATVSERDELGVSHKKERCRRVPCNVYGISQTADYTAIAERIENAGSVFMGPYTPESAGDYASGTNHTLPTNGYAKAYSGVNLDSFIKKITFQEITSDGIRALGSTIQTMAANEQLDAHRNAVTIRLNTI